MLRYSPSPRRNLYLVGRSDLGLWFLKRILVRLVFPLLIIRQSHKILGYWLETLEAYFSPVLTPLARIVLEMTFGDEVSIEPETFRMEPILLETV